MDEESAVKLIKLVEMHSVLYKKIDKELVNNRMFLNAWEKITVELNKPGIDPRMEWNKIRNNFYSRTLHRIVNKYKKFKPCRYEKELLFLLPYFNYPEEYRNDAILYIQNLVSSYQCTRNEIVQTYRSQSEYCNFIQEDNYQQHIIDNSITEAPLTRNSLGVIQPYNETGLYYNQDASVNNSLNNLSNYFISYPQIQNQIGQNYFQSNVIEPNYVSFPTQINTSSCNAYDASEFYYPPNTSQIYGTIDSSYLSAAEEPSYASHSLQWNTHMPSATQHNLLTYLPEINNQNFFHF